MAGKQKISYFYDPDVGNFYYGQVTSGAGARAHTTPPATSLHTGPHRKNKLFYFSSILSSSLFLREGFEPPVSRSVSFGPCGCALHLRSPHPHSAVRPFCYISTPPLTSSLSPLASVHAALWIRRAIP
jgi:hypothetical protein